MKNKTKFLLTSLFILVAFLLLGTTNVNAATVEVANESQLKAAVDGQKEVDGVTVNDPDTTIVKLVDDIVLTSDLSISPIIDLTLDLNGHIIDGIGEENNNKSVYISYGTNGIQTFTSGSLTIKDSSDSKTGIIKSYNSIGLSGTNYKDEDKHFALTIEGGKFYVIQNSIMFSLSDNDYYMKNTTFDFEIKDGYFETTGDYAMFLRTDNTVTNNVTLNVNYEKLTFKNSSLQPRLIYLDKDIRVNDVVSEDSNIKLKYTVTNSEGALEDRTLSAKDWNAFGDVIGNYNIIEITKAEGFDVSDVTLNETYGYTTATSVAIPIKNRGTNPLKIKNVSVSSANFKVVGSSALIEWPIVVAGATDNTSYTIEAMPELNAGTYTGVITVTDENDDTYTSIVTLTVAKKQILTLGVGYNRNWKYGESPETLNKYGVEDLSTDQYVIDYSVHNSYEWSTTEPTLVGNYDVRIRVTDPNYDNSQAAISNFRIIENDAEIRIIAATNEWTYDGEIHKDTSYIVKYNGEVKAGGVLPTGDIVSDVSISATVKDVKDNRENNNEIDSFELPNYNCYSDVKIVAGTIKINPITTPIVVTADSDTKSYDGNALTKNTYTYTNDVLVIGDTLNVTMTGSQTYVGTSDNTISEVKVIRDGVDISNNYTFGTHVKGTLEVTAIDQPLSIADQYVTINGKLLTSELEEALNGDYGNVSFEKKSGDAGEYDNETIGGFLAGSATGTVVMTAKATSFDVNSDGTAEYNETEKDFNINVVTKETVTISGITNNQEFTYDGNAKTPAGTIIVNDNKVEASELEVSYEGTGITIYSSTTAPTNAGTYSVTYKVPNSNANYSGEATFNFTINKVKLPKVTLKQNSYLYTGNVINAEFNNYDADKMILSGDTSAKNVNSNSYIVSVTLKDTTNYIWDGAGPTSLMLLWNITKANPSYEDLVPDNLTGLKGQTLNDITLPTGFTWDNTNTELVVGTHKYNATYTPDDINNFNIINNIKIIVVTKDIFNVTTSVVGGEGTINGPFTNVVEGSTKEIIFTPETGFMIDKVLVNDVETTITNNKLTLTVDANKNVTVRYKKIPVTITVLDTEGATITPNGIVIVNYGDSKEFIITANSGYRLLKVFIDEYDVTDQMSGDKLLIGNITGDAEIRAVVEKIVYEVIEGANQTYTITKNSEAKFRIDAEYGMFEDGGKVYVDDELVDEENYTSKSGSTIITLKQEYVNTLAVGQHTLKVVFADNGEAITNFTIAKIEEQPTTDNNSTNTESKEDKVSNPKTFDNILIYVVIAGISVIGLGTTFVIKKRTIK